MIACFPVSSCLSHSLGLPSYVNSFEVYHRLWEKAYQYTDEISDPLFQCPVNTTVQETVMDISRHKNAVTNSGFYSRWKFISVPKSQHTTVKYNQPFSKHTRESTLSDVPHKTPSTGPLLVISQHELTFLQSVSLQIQVRAQPLRSSGTNSHSCNQEASTHTCFSRYFPILTQSSNQQQSVAKHTRLHSAISKHGLTTNQQTSVDNNPVTIETCPPLLSHT
jgi:hypothetical protein